MPTLELTEEQALSLWEQLPDTQKKRIVAQTVQNENKPLKRRRQAGSGKEAVLYVAPDFYEPVEGFEDYQ